MANKKRVVIETNRGLMAIPRIDERVQIGLANAPLVQDAAADAAAAAVDDALATNPTISTATALAPGIASRNITPATMGHWRAAVADVRAGIADAKLLCIGDSNTWGIMTGSMPVNAYPTRLGEMLHRAYAPAQNGLIIPIVIGSAEEDTRVNRGAWALDAYGFAGKATWGTSGANVLTITPGVMCDSFTIYYVQNTSLGSIDISIDGGAATRQSTIGAAFAIGSVTVTGSRSNTHVLTITGVGDGYVALLGVEPFDSTTATIRVGNAGVSGTQSVDWASTSAASTEPMLDAYGADLTIIMLGVNDADYGVSVTDYTARMTTVIQRAKATGDVLILSPMLVHYEPAISLEQGYRDVLMDLALSEGCGFLDIQARLGSNADAYALGMKADNYHPNARGAADIAGSVFAALSQV